MQIFFNKKENNVAAKFIENILFSNITLSKPLYVTGPCFKIVTDMFEKCRGNAQIRRDIDNIRLQWNSNIVIGVSVARLRGITGDIVYLENELVKPSYVK